MNNNTVISDIRILPIDGKNNCVAIASFTLFDCLNLTGIKMYETDNKRSVAFPKNPGNKHKLHYVYPVDTKIKSLIEDKLWEAFYQA